MSGLPLNLPLGGLDDTAWRLPRIEPTNLIVPCPGSEAPSADAVIEAMRLARPELRVVDVRDGEAGLCWCRVIDTGATAPLVLWAEPERSGTTTADGAWVVGAETLLDEGDPISALAALMRLLLEACPDASSLLDVNTSSWYRHRELIDLLGVDDLDPPADLLWVVHVVRDESGDGPAWLHTHGLWRCGRPELEMLEVPPAHVPAAIDLVNRVAEILLEIDDLPAGAPLEIGPDLRVTLQPWSDAARYLRDGAPGADTARDPAHRGLRAAICAQKASGSFRAVWTWPGEVVSSLERDDAAVYLTTRATRRQARLAQRAWPHLVSLLAPTTADEDLQARRDLTVLIKSPAPETPADAPRREHLWLVLRETEGEQVTGELAGDSMDDPGLRRGDVVTVDRASVTDWRVVVPAGTFGPEDALSRESGEPRWNELCRALTRVGSEGGA